jgi:hypothetical protein
LGEVTYRKTFLWESPHGSPVFRKPVRIRPRPLDK